MKLRLHKIISKRFQICFPNIIGSEMTESFEKVSKENNNKADVAPLTYNIKLDGDEIPSSFHHYCSEKVVPPRVL